jgi:hypothetical protein
MENDIKILMEDIRVVSKLVIQQQEEYEQNPMHNEYMRLQFNVGVLKDLLTRLQEEMKMK